MVLTFLKRILYLILGLFFLWAFLMLVPRIHSAIFPNDHPIGYHYLWTTYAAVAVGLEKVIDLSPEVPDDLELLKDIEYKSVEGGAPLQVDICKSRDLANGAPLVILFHGGGWRKGHRADMLPLMMDFARRGYVTATVSYRLRRPYPECVEDACDAVDWFFEHGAEYGYDPDRVAIVGASAGAHLAMLAGYGWKYNGSTSGRHKVKAVVNIFGAADLTTDFGQKEDLVKSFMVKSYEEAPDLWKEASPINYINRHSPPTMTLHGTSDELVPVDQADLLKEKLENFGVPIEDHRYPLWPHAMVLVQRVYDHCMPMIDDFIRQYVDHPTPVTVELNTP